MFGGYIDEDERSQRSIYSNVLLAVIALLSYSLFAHFQAKKMNKDAYLEYTQTYRAGIKIIFISLIIGLALKYFFYFVVYVGFIHRPLGPILWIIFAVGFVWTIYSGFAVKKHVVEHNWALWPTFEEYRLSLQNSNRELSCRSCGSEKLRVEGLTSRSDLRRIHTCIACSSVSYRSSYHG
jgi:hypothetical protein